MTALTLTLVLLSATDAGGAVLSSTVRRLAEGACLRVACDLSGGMPLEVLHFEHPLPYVSLETRRRASVSTQPVFECMCARLHVDLASTLSTGSFGWSSIPKNRHWSHCARSARWAAGWVHTGAVRPQNWWRGPRGVQCYWQAKRARHISFATRRCSRCCRRLSAGRLQARAVAWRRRW